MQKKNDVIEEICLALNIAQIETTVGSSVPRKLFSEILSYFELPDDGGAIEAAQQILELANMEWKPSYDSRSSPSGGGGTITLEGLIGLHEAINVLLDIEDGDDESQFSYSRVLSPEEWTLFEGQKIKRTDLHNRFGGVRQGGISPSNRTKNIFIFSDDVSNQAHGYEYDHWIDAKTFAYCGEGQIGDQTLARYNLSIFEHKKSGKAIRLFEGSKGEVKYVGKFNLDLTNPYFTANGIGRDGSMREVIMFRLIKEELGVNLSTSSETDVEAIGIPYRFLDEVEVGYSQAEPFSQNPDEMDRAQLSHTITQNAVAKWLIEHDLVPLSPSPKDPPFDIAWICRGKLMVAEIKSINAENENHQFRFGIGQVLEYCFQLDASPVLVLSDKPKDEMLAKVANRYDIHLAWPGILKELDPRRL